MDWMLTNLSGEHLANYLLILGGGQRSGESVAPADPGVRSVTACSGQSVSLSCQAGAQISLVRAVWGRFSLAICNSGVRGGNFLQMLKSTTCGDTVTPLQIISSHCQGQNHCQVEADNSVFGDPCPVEEFLEVQFHCLEPPKQEMIKRPEFSDKKIANLWADDKNINIEQIILEELSLSRKHENRIPITEASLPEVRLGEDDFPWRLRSEESKMVWIVGTACVLMLPLILLLTVMILKTNTKKKTTCHIQHLSKPNMMFCRLENGAGNCTRKFSSEPSLVAHNCLLDSSASLLRYS